MVIGEIVQESASSFSWKEQEYYSCKEFMTCESSDFQYNGRTWYLQWYIHKKEFGNVRSLRLIWKRIHHLDPFAQTYRLRLKSDKCGYYWTSPILTDKFCHGNYHGTDQDILECDLIRDHRRVYDDGVRFVHLEFDATEERHPRSLIGVDELVHNFKNVLLDGHKSGEAPSVRGTVSKARGANFSSRSKVFKGMIYHDASGQNSADITDSGHEDFRAFLHRLDTGNVDKTPPVERAVELYCLADEYNVEGLGPYCVGFLLGNLTVESFCSIAPLLLRHCKTELVDLAVAFFVRNMKQIVGNDKWIDFNKANPTEAAELLRGALEKGTFLPDSGFKKMRTSIFKLMKKSESRRKSSLLSKFVA